MRQLDGRHAAVFLEEVNDGLEGLCLGVVPQAEVVGADPAARLDAGGLDDDQPGAAHGPAAQVDQMPVGGYAVLGENGIHAHRRDPQPVTGGDIAHAVGREQVGLVFAHFDCRVP